MNLKNFLIMAGFTIGTIILALWLSDLNGPSVDYDPNRPFYPELASNFDRVRQLRIDDGTRQVTLNYRDGIWQLQQRQNFAADTVLVDELLTQVINLYPLQPRSLNPDHYPQLGVAEPGTNGAGIQIIGVDENGAEMFSFLAGKRMNGEENRQFIRRTGEPRPWLVLGYVNPPVEPELWLQRTIIDIAPEEIRAISYEAPEPGRLERDRRDDPDLHLPAEATAAAPQDFLNMQAQLLSELRMADFIPAAQEDFSGLQVARTRVSTFDGLIITLETATRDGRHLLRINTAFQDPRDGGDDQLAQQAHADPQQIFAQARIMNLRHQHWVYVISSDRALSLSSPLNRVNTASRAI